MPEPLDARERRELCDLLEELGPDAPTLCEGWTTIDLAAHLVVRERDLRAAPGILLGGRFEAGLDRLMVRAKATGYRTLVDRVRNGPPLGPMAVPGLRTLLNLNEYVVHHEDVRRANGLQARVDRADLDDTVWDLLRRQARLMLRKVDGARVLVERAGGATVTAGRGPEVTLAGPPVELLLYLFGRREAAVVEITGDEGAQDALASATLGI
ncbi:MAG: TIGR03085 family metal-binding protein [Acidimicrobiales bacterium]